MSVLCSTADAVSLNSSFIVFKVLPLKVALVTMFLQLSMLGLDSVADFSNSEAKAPTSAECTLFFTAVRGDAVWMKGFH